MELIKAASRRTFLSELVYIALNVLLAVGVFAMVRVFDPPWLAVVLILLSKWRVFAVRPRFWFQHVQTNLVDTLVGLSVIALLYQSAASLGMQIFITLLYIAWLVVLKPRARRRDMTLQAGVSQFVALTALASFSYVLPSAVVVVGAWLIGYASARHFLSSYDEDTIELSSLAYGFILAELGWLYYHWMVAYPLPGGLAIPQLAIVAMLVSFVSARLYNIYRHKDRVTIKDVRAPLVFLVAILFILFILFTPWNVVL
jgi:hypothetical protein